MLANIGRVHAPLICFLYIVQDTTVLLGFIARDEVSDARNATKHIKCF